MKRRALPTRIPAPVLFAGGLALTICAQPAHAAGVEDFYKGRTVSIIIGYSVGGGYDTYGRLLSRYLGDHIPGRAHHRAAEHAGRRQPSRRPTTSTGCAAKDGTAIGTFGRTIAVAPLLAAAGANFDGTKFTWLGSISKDMSLCVTWEDPPIKTWDDLLAKPSTFGGEGAGADPDVFTLTVKNVFGAKVKLVTGYPGTNESRWRWSAARSTDLRPVLEHPEEPSRRLAQQQVDQHHRPGRAQKIAASCPTCRSPPTSPRDQEQAADPQVRRWRARRWRGRSRRRPASPADRKAALAARRSTRR